MQRDQESAANRSGRLAGKIAVVTGAGSRGAGIGTGKAISILFARAGARVCLVDLSSERAAETLAVIEEEGGEAFVIQADASQERDCERVIADAVKRYGRVDLLVNNVGITDGGGPIHNLDIEAWDNLLAVNLKSVVLMSKYAIRQMIESGGGAIVNIASVAGLLAHGAPAYGAAKAGMIMLTRDTAFMYGRHQIRANVIAPGHIYTPLVAGMSDATREWRTRVAPLGIEGTAWDVAWAALFLASDEARFITGHCLPVDAGVTQMAPLMTRSSIIHDGEPLKLLDVPTPAGAPVTPPAPSSPPAPIVGTDG